MNLDIIETNTETITQLRIEIGKAHKLCKSLCGSVYKDAIFDDIVEAWRILNKRFGTATPQELERYDVFCKHGVFHYFSD